MSISNTPMIPTQSVVNWSFQLSSNITATDIIVYYMFGVNWWPSSVVTSSSPLRLLNPILPLVWPITISQMKHVTSATIGNTGITALVTSDKDKHLITFDHPGLDRLTVRYINGKSIAEVIITPIPAIRVVASSDWVDTMYDNLKPVCDMMVNGNVTVDQQTLNHMLSRYTHNILDSTKTEIDIIVGWRGTSVVGVTSPNKIIARTSHSLWNLNHDPSPSIYKKFSIIVDELTDILLTTGTNTSPVHSYLDLHFDGLIIDWMPISFTTDQFTTIYKPHINFKGDHHLSQNGHNYRLMSDFTNTLHAMHPQLFGMTP